MFALKPIVLVSLFWAFLPAVHAAGLQSSRVSVDDVMRQVSCKVSELCFAIDGSGSISNKEFQMELNFIELIVDQVADAVEGAVRYSASIFSSRAKVAQKATSDMDEFVNAINNIDQPGGSTNMARGLQVCQDQFTSSNLQKVIVLVTDGLDNGNPLAEEIISDIKSKGTIVITVGVGNGIDEDYLKDLASVPEYFVSSKKFKTLPQEVVDVTFKLCQPPVPVSPPSATPSPVADPNTKACQKAFKKCKLRFGGSNNVQTFSFPSKPGVFSTKLVPKVARIVLDDLKTLEVQSSIVNDDGSLTAINKLKAKPRLRKDQFEADKKKNPALEYKKFRGNQASVISGKCVRVEVEVEGSKKPLCAVFITA